MKRSLYFFMVGIFGMTFLLAFGPTCVAGDKGYRVGTWKTAQTIQPFYYGNFLDNSQKVNVFAFTNPADQKVALLAGSLDMCGTTLAHAIASASRGEPIVVVASLCNKCSALVVKKDGPVKTTADLSGKRIGYVPGTMHEILLRETLTRNGISPDRDVELMRVDFFDMGLALARGSIDAFLSGEPFPTRSKVKGYGHILAYPYYGETIGSINAGMIVTRKAVANNRAMVQRLVWAHVKATRYLQKNKEQWLQKASTFGTEISILQQAKNNMELSWDMDSNFVHRARFLGQRMQSLGIIHQQPHYDKLFDLSFVKSIRETL